MSTVCDMYVFICLFPNARSTNAGLFIWYIIIYVYISIDIYIVCVLALRSWFRTGSLFACKKSLLHMQFKMIANTRLQFTTLINMRYAWNTSHYNSWDYITRCYKDIQRCRTLETNTSQQKQSMHFGCFSLPSLFLAVVESWVYESRVAFVKEIDDPWCHGWSEGWWFVTDEHRAVGTNLWSLSQPDSHAEHFAFGPGTWTHDLAEATTSSAGADFLVWRGSCKWSHLMVAHDFDFAI